jgi:hypothetical protein
MPGEHAYNDATRWGRNCGDEGTNAQEANRRTRTGLDANRRVRLQPQRMTVEEDPDSGRSDDDDGGKVGWLFDVLADDIAGASLQTKRTRRPLEFQNVDVSGCKPSRQVRDILEGVRQRPAS